MSQLPEFVKVNVLGCLCTSDESCNPFGATIFYAVKNEKIYCMTHKDSQKAKHVSNNPNVCLVVANQIDYEQAQVYATAKIVSNPLEYASLLIKVISEYSEKTKEMIPYMDINSEGKDSVVIELTPARVKSFKSGKGLTENQP